MSQHQFHEHAAKGRVDSTVRQFLDNEASGGLVLMAVALLALIAANSPVASSYFALLQIYVGPLSIQHWINDALMAVFFLLVGLEIKREMLDGQLSSWSSRILPGAAAAGGMLVPALIYVAFNHSNPAALQGWAIPTATDIAFALGVLSLLGPRVPVSLKVFLTALAIIDDLGAVIVIALFYTADLNLLALGGAAFVFASLVAFNRLGGMRLWPYLIFGVILWALVLKSGVHTTLAGVILSLAIPIRLTPGNPEASPNASLLHKLEHVLQKPVAFLIVPIFGFANAGVPLAGVTPSALIEPLMLGVGSGLIIGKLIGVFGAVALIVKLGFADLPSDVGWDQLLGVSLLCGIGFTMSLFIGVLAFDDPAMQDHAKIGVLAGSMIAGLAGYLVLRGTGRRKLGHPS
ncbi:Na+/H+ antiporter NhaA [Sinorhizobium numidicum]|uniref:Na(+)/H(+) antiporter NhaA n=1 Tax=Sinorhizobium numidicum TaxID=680248 RepID=A0ABY8CRP3_9HYPH|nr:Na+/H+ antiporter NhaA [Sinorhizobium numidicum]WEX75269.1 Na+/H+ antiporter NhaA [Sinorhizobium numidicum]WEX81264.1 Na+/H+ antiporter NhaA [Sinorhizobium numidicum]